MAQPEISKILEPAAMHRLGYGLFSDAAQCNEQAYALLECFWSTRLLDQGVQLRQFRGHKLKGVWEKLISQPHQIRLLWKCAFFHEIGAAMAQKNSTTKANISGAPSWTSAHRRSSAKRKAL